MNKRLCLFTLWGLLHATFSANAESINDNVPKLDSLKGIAQELNKTARGGEVNRQTVSRNTDLEGVARGASLYRKNCIQCHRKDGVGAPNWHRRDAAGNYPAPPLNGSAHTWHHPKAHLLEMIRNGGTVMPAFNSKLEDHEIDDIIKWFQSLWPDELYQAWARQNEAFERNAN